MDIKVILNDSKRPVCACATCGQFIGAPSNGVTYSYCYNCGAKFSRPVSARSMLRAKSRYKLKQVKGLTDRALHVVMYEYSENVITVKAVVIDLYAVESFSQYDYKDPDTAYAKQFDVSKRYGFACYKGSDKFLCRFKDGHSIAVSSSTDLTKSPLYKQITC